MDGQRKIYWPYLRKENFRKSRRGKIDLAEGKPSAFLRLRFRAAGEKRAQILETFREVLRLIIITSFSFSLFSSLINGDSQGKGN